MDFINLNSGEDRTLNIPSLNGNSTINRIGINQRDDDENSVPGFEPDLDDVRAKMISNKSVNLADSDDRRASQSPIGSPHFSNALGGSASPRYQLRDDDDDRERNSSRASSRHSDRRDSGDRRERNMRFSDGDVGVLPRRDDGYSRRNDQEDRRSERGSDHGFNDYGEAEIIESPEEKRKRLIKERREKLYLLGKIERFIEKGVSVSGNFTINTPLEDLKLEVERLEYKTEMSNTVNGYKDNMMFFTGICELGSKYFGIGKIQGYKEQLYNDLYSDPYKYDSTLEELYEKHRDKPKMSPEMRLMMMMGGGMFMYHMSNVMMPQLGAQRAMPQVQQPQANVSVNNDPILLEKMREARSKSAVDSQPIGNLRVERQTMRGPQGVDDLLRSFENKNNIEEDGQSAAGESVLDDNVSLSASEIASGKPRRRRKNKSANNTFVLDL